MSYSDNKKTNKQSGFTLIELTFVVLIFGLMVAMFLPVYNLYVSNQAEQTTQENTDLIVGEITEFLTVHGRYPCPAPPAVDRNDDDYGRESNECELEAIALGTCDASTNDPTSGICIETSQNADSTVERIIIGAVPFRELNIQESESYDGYSNKLTYAVTEILTKPDQYQPELGGIRILDPNGEDLDDDFGIHFIVYSHGENSLGAYNSNGIQIACATDSAEELENCYGTGGNAQFQIALRSNNFADDNEYDDVAAFIATDDIPHFALMGESDDIEFMSGDEEGRLGMLLPDGIESTPEQELDVGGNVRAQDAVESNQLCTYGNESECFSADLIAGDDPNMECASGFVVRIQNGAVVCDEEVIAQCDAGEIMVGVNPDGTAICQVYNAPECASVEVDLCPTSPGTVTLPVGQDNEYYRANERDLPTKNRYQWYRCRDGSWQPHNSPWGPCDCIEGEELDRDTLGCGECQSGTYDRVRLRTCPSGSEYVTENSTCSCDPLTPCIDTRTDTCDAGFTLVGDERIEERVFECSSTGVPGGWGDWELRAGVGTCECIPEDPDYSTMACSQLAFYLTEIDPDRRIPTVREFDCDSNSYGPRQFDDTAAGVPGSLSGASLYSTAVRDEYCTCNTSLDPQTRQVSCSSLYPGWTGVIDEQRDYNCVDLEWGDYYPVHPDLSSTSSDEEIRDAFCTELPEVVCRWQKGTPMGGTSKTFLGEQEGSVCDCDMDEDDKIDNCHDPLPGGTSAKNYAGCYCG